MAGAFDLGAAKARILFDDSDYQKGVKETKSSTLDMAKSFLGAELALQGLNKAFAASQQFVKESIKLAIDFGEINSKFGVVFKKVSKQAENTSKELVKSYGLSNKAAKELLSSTGDLLSGFGFTQDKSLELSGAVQKLASDLASFSNIEGGTQRASEALTKALLGETESAKALGIVIRQTDVMTRLAAQGKDKLTGMALMQAKAETTLQMAIEQSTNAIGDFQRTSQSLANQQRILENRTEDLKIAIGELLLPVMGELTKQSLDATNAFLQLVESSKLLKEISNKSVPTLKIFFNILSTIGKTIGKEVGALIDVIAEAFKDLTGEMTINIPIMELLAAILKIVSINFAVGVKIVKTMVQGLIDLVLIGKDVIDVFVNIGKSIFQPSKWKEVKEAVKDLGGSIKDLAIDSIANWSDIINTVVGGFAKLPETASIQAREWKTIWEDASNETNNTIQNNLDDTLRFTQDWAVIVGRSMIAPITKIKPAWQQFRDDFQEGWDNVGSKILETTSFFLEKIKGMIQSISETVRMFYQNDLDTLIATNQAKITALEEDKELQLANLQDLRDRGIITEEEFNEKKAQIEKDTGEKIEKQRKENKKKENALKKKAFEGEKQNEIATAWIQFAVGVVGAWAQSIVQLGPIAGSIMAAVLTAALLGVTIAQTVAISQRKYVPELARGGRASGPAIINEQGPEAVHLPDGSIVVPADITAAAIGAAGGMQGGTIINVSFAGARISDDMSLKKIVNAVSKEFSRQLRTAGG